MSLRALARTSAKAVPVTHKISQATNSNSLGFTLIELMVVVAILAGMIGLAVPYISGRNEQTRQFLRHLTVLSKTLHRSAKLQGVVYRLVLDLGQEGERDRVQKYWVEKSNGKVFLRENEEEAELERLREQRDNPGDEEKKKNPKGFEPDPTFMKEPVQLPRGIHFEKIEIARLKEPVTSGRAYIHYIPEGLVDEAALQIRGDQKQGWTISIHPLTGKAELTAKVVSLREIKEQ